MNTTEILNPTTNEIVQNMMYCFWPDLMLRPDYYILLGSESGVLIAEKDANVFKEKYQEVVKIMNSQGKSTKEYVIQIYTGKNGIYQGVRGIA